MSQQPPQQPSDKDTDPFRPPSVPCEVQCIHCGETYESWQIEWRELPDDSPLSGTWCCPTPDCDGIGFGFDIMPTDPNWVDENGERIFTCPEDEDDEDDDPLQDTWTEDAIELNEADKDTLWVRDDRAKPKSHGNTPQPPFNQTFPPLSDDDIPF